jgi:hypothetical protein
VSEDTGIENIKTRKECNIVTAVVITSCTLEDDENVDI